MRYWLGTGFVLASAWLVYSGIGHRARARANAQPKPAEESQLVMMGEIVRPLILFALAYVGLKTSSPMSGLTDPASCRCSISAGSWLC